MSQSFILPFKFQHPSRNMCDESRKMESELIIKNIDRKVKMLGTITLRLRASGFTRLAWPNISFGKRGDYPTWLVNLIKPLIKMFYFR